MYLAQLGRVSLAFFNIDSAISHPTAPYRLQERSLPPLEQPFADTLKPAWLKPLTESPPHPDWRQRRGSPSFPPPQTARVAEGLYQARRQREVVSPFLKQAAKTQARQPLPDLGLQQLFANADKLQAPQKNTLFNFLRNPFKDTAQSLNPQLPSRFITAPVRLTHLVATPQDPEKARRAMLPVNPLADHLAHLTPTQRRENFREFERSALPAWKLELFKQQARVAEQDKPTEGRRFQLLSYLWPLGQPVKS